MSPSDSTPPLRTAPATEASDATFLTIGDSRVYCVGCKQWVETEGFCEGDPDICPVGEEPSQARSPTLAEAQAAIDALAEEIRELDELSAPTPAAPDTGASDQALSDIARTLSVALGDSPSDTADRIIRAIVSLRAVSVPAATGETEETRWLLAFHVGGPKWVAGFKETSHSTPGGATRDSCSWVFLEPIATTDANVAIAFSRERDARAMLGALELPYRELLRAEEHLWTDSGRPIPAATTAGEGSPRDLRQSAAARWVRTTFGDSAMRTSERLARFYEEATELAQSLGADAEFLSRIIGVVYSRPAGVASQEAGGVGLTLLALAEAERFSADASEAHELERVLSKSGDHFRARQAAKADLGISEPAVASRSTEAPVSETPATAWVVWSNEHDAWWREKSHGYTTSLLGAGIYSEADARGIERRSKGASYADRQNEQAMPLAEAIARENSPGSVAAHLTTLQHQHAETRDDSEDGGKIFGIEQDLIDSPPDGDSDGHWVAVVRWLITIAKERESALTAAAHQHAEQEERIAERHRASVLWEAAQAVCSECRTGYAPISTSLGWLHQHTRTNATPPIPCMAGAIRDLFRSSTGTPTP